MARTTPNMPTEIPPNPAGVPDIVDTGGDLGADARAAEAADNSKPRPRVPQVGLADIHKLYGKGRRK